MGVKVIEEFSADSVSLKLIVLNKNRKNEKKIKKKIYQEKYSKPNQIIS